MPFFKFLLERFFLSSWRICFKYFLFLTINTITNMRSIVEKRFVCLFSSYWTKRKRKEPVVATTSIYGKITERTYTHSSYTCPYAFPIMTVIIQGLVSTIDLPILTNFSLSKPPTIGHNTSWLQPFQIKWNFIDHHILHPTLTRDPS